MPKRVGKRFHICSRHYGKFVLVMAMFGGNSGNAGKLVCVDGLRLWMDFNSRDISCDYVEGQLTLGELGLMDISNLIMYLFAMIISALPLGRLL